MTYFTNTLESYPSDAVFLLSLIHMPIVFLPIPWTSDMPFPFKCLCQSFLMLMLTVMVSTYLMYWNSYMMLWSPQGKGFYFSEDFEMLQTFKMLAKIYNKRKITLIFFFFFGKICKINSCLWNTWKTSIHKFIKAGRTIKNYICCGLCKKSIFLTMCGTR